MRTIVGKHISSTRPAVTLVVALLCGCSGQTAMPGGNDNNAPTTTEDVSLATQVQPIFTQHCAGCHSPGGAAVLQGIAMQLTENESYGSLVNQPSDQQMELTLVVPGDAAASLLLAKVSQVSPPVGDRMPPFGPALSDEEIALIEGWIEQGALNN